MPKMRQPLADKILENSVSKHLPTAIKEWTTIAKIHNEIDGEIRCLCGTRGIKDWYELKNARNGKTLIHVGANCIEYFTSATDFLPAKAIKKLGQLKRLAHDQQVPSFTKTSFPMELIKYFLENDVFFERPENHYHAYNDYKRLAELIHKGGRKANFTPEEYEELIDLWEMVIRPFLMEQPSQQLHRIPVENEKQTIESLKAEIAGLKQEIESLRAQLPQGRETKASASNAKTTVPAVPSSYKALQTIARRRKNKRLILPSDLNQELLEYLEQRQFLSKEQAATIKKAMISQNYALNDYLRKEVTPILETLTARIKKDKLPI